MITFDLVSNQRRLLSSQQRSYQYMWCDLRERKPFLRGYFMTAAHHQHCKKVLEDVLTWWFQISQSEARALGNRWKSSSVKSTLAAWAIASKWRVALVEPPSAMVTVIASSKASRVKISDGLSPFPASWQQHDLLLRYRPSYPLIQRGEKMNLVSSYQGPRSLSPWIGRIHPTTATRARAGITL